jgi:DNA-binding FadR family transcriptional regulator
MIKNVHGNTLDFLGEAIVAGRYAENSAMPPEAALGDELGVSRTVVREAIKSLVAKGLVTTGPKVGTKVVPSNEWNWFDPDVIMWKSKAGLTRAFLQDLQELRRIVEPAAVKLAAERATAKDIAKIELAYAGMKRAIDDGGDYVSFDLLFHQGLLNACGNRMLIQMNKVLSALLRTSFELSTTKKDGPRNSLPYHRAVLDAVIAKKPDEAEAAILFLIDDARDDIEMVLSSRRRLPRLNEPAHSLPSQQKEQAL